MVAMGLKIPDPPEYSYIAQSILEAYNLISRSRRYEQSTPLALSLADIESYCELYDLPIDAHIFVQAITAVDDLFLDKVLKRAP